MHNGGRVLVGGGTDMLGVRGLLHGPGGMFVHGGIVATQCRRGVGVLRGTSLVAKVSPGGCGEF